MPNPFVHIELTSNDLNLSKKFYKKVFAWDLRDMPGFDYTMIDVGTGVGGGMQGQRAPEAPTGWLAYVEVDDVKKTLAKAAAAGATVLMDYTPIGADMGAIAILADPTGCSIGIWEQGAARAAARESNGTPKPSKKAASRKAKPRATDAAGSKKAAKKASKKATKKSGKKATKKK